MSNDTRFLRPDAIVEPLLDGFYGWMHTVAPVQAAMNLALVQVPLLESYLQSPQMHINASSTPALRGGFFVNIEESRIGEVRDLLAAIKRDRTDMLDFAAAVAEAEELVRGSATGLDLTPLYPKLPPALSGLVELAYDTSNQARARGLRLRDGRGKLAWSRHGHLLQRRLLPAQAGRRIHDAVCRARGQIGSSAQSARMALVTGLPPHANFRR